MKRSVYGFILAMAWPVAAGANPVAVETLVVQQVPGTTHVQVTLAYDSSMADPAIEGASRDGQALGATWSQVEVFQTNMGSGVQAVSGYQYCDCDVSVGAHSYIVSVGGDYSNDYPYPIDVTDGGAQRPDVPVGTGGAGGVMPWDEPNPTEIQGLDCMAQCSGAGPEAGGAGSGEPPSGTNGGEGTEPEVAADTGGGKSGCALGAGAPRSGWLAVLLVSVTLLLRRRRGRAKAEA